LARLTSGEGITPICTDDADLKTGNCKDKMRVSHSTSLRAGFSTAAANAPPLVEMTVHS
jgi:hypothetical protein